MIVEAVRTPIGKRNGWLRGSRPRTARFCPGRGGQTGRHRPFEVEQVVGGCVTQAGEQGFNVTRIAWLLQGLPYEVAATTVDCQCGSSQQANHFVNNLIGVGAIEVGIACGVEAMSRVPSGANVGTASAKPSRDLPWDLPDQFQAAERIAEKYGITRADVDWLGLVSQEKAAKAVAEDRFAREMCLSKRRSSARKDPGGSTAAAHRPAGTRAPRDDGRRVGQLKPVLPDGCTPPATPRRSPTGPAAVLWMSEDRARAEGLRPRRGSWPRSGRLDPYFHLDGPIAATAKVLDKAGMAMADIDLFEVNEAFAPWS